MQTYNLVNEEYMKINKEWHAAHPMPENPTLKERVVWHIAHARHCGCREIPANLRAIIKKRNLKIFTNDRIGE